MIVKFNMKTFLEDAKNSTYRIGSYSNSQHEGAVRDLLVQNGGVEVNLTKQMKSTWKKHDYAELPEGHFIHQPSGNNDHPDFVIKYNQTIVPIECKSSKGWEPIYNSVPPIRGVTYIFASAKADCSAVYMGEDVMTDDERDHFVNVRNQMQDIADSVYNINYGGFRSSYVRNNYYQPPHIDLFDPRQFDCRWKSVLKFHDVE